MQGLISPKGELFAYRRGNRLYTLEDELTGIISHDTITDLAGVPRWRILGDGVYTLDGLEAIGYFGAPTPSAFDR